MNPQRTFLAGEFFGLSLQGATQRAGIYKPEATAADRKELHVHLREHLERCLEQYSEEVDDHAHCKNIERIANSLTRRHAGLLRDNRFRIGPTQKALNLYLKYMWCVEEVARPPHCPIDSIVIKASGLPATVKWTELTRIDEYMAIVSRLRQVASPLPLAEWELREWVRSDALYLPKREQ